MKQVMRVGHLPLYESGVGLEKTHRKGELGVVVGEREGCGRWRGENARNLWRVGDLELKIFTGRKVVGLDRELRWIDLCNALSICTVGRHPKREAEHAFTRRIPGLVWTDGGDEILGNVGRDRRATNVGGEGVSYDLFVPRLLPGPNALKGDVKVLGKTGYPSERPRGTSILLKVSFGKLYGRD
jgi:hypothetical protein